MAAVPSYSVTRLSAVTKPRRTGISEGVTIRAHEGLLGAIGLQCVAPRQEASRTGLARVCGDVGLAGESVAGRRQAGSGRARNRARARSNWASQGQRCGRCSVRWRAERVIRPREKNRRRRVLVVTTCSPRPMRAVQGRGRYAARRRWRRSGPRGDGSTWLEVSEADSMVGLQFEFLRRQLGTGVGFIQVHSGRECRWSRPHRRRRPSSREWESRHPLVSPR